MGCSPFWGQSSVFRNASISAASPGFPDAECSALFATVMKVREINNQKTARVALDLGTVSFTGELCISAESADEARRTATGSLTANVFQFPCTRCQGGQDRFKMTVSS